MCIRDRVKVFNCNICKHLVTHRLVTSLKLPITTRFKNKSSSSGYTKTHGWCFYIKNQIFFYKYHSTYVIIKHIFVVLHAMSRPSEHHYTRSTATLSPVIIAAPLLPIRISISQYQWQYYICLLYTSMELSYDIISIICLYRVYFIKNILKSYHREITHRVFQFV